jgi:large subunit ribosomal protein L3
LTSPTDRAIGDVVTVGVFEEMGVRFVDVVGTTIGKGYQGVMKRHRFGGQPATHGTERKHRSPGGIGGSGDRGRAVASRRASAWRADGACALHDPNQRLVSIDKDRNLLLIKGAVPGPKGCYVVVSKSKAKS